MAPLFSRFGSKAPTTLTAIYKSFNDDDDMLRVLVRQAPPVELPLRLCLTASTDRRP